MSKTPLSRDGRIEIDREFHVEILRGGMNRLLLRSMPTEHTPIRIEVFFQYVRYMDMTMKFGSLTITDVTDRGQSAVAAILAMFPETRIYELSANEGYCGRVAAAACVVGEDSAAASAESMFPMLYTSPSTEATRESR